MEKKLYNGKFNWHGELHSLYTHASSEAQAKQLLLLQLTRKLPFMLQHVKSYFNYQPNSYIIKEIID